MKVAFSKWLCLSNDLYGFQKKIDSDTFIGDNSYQFEYKVGKYGPHYLAS